MKVLKASAVILPFPEGFASFENGRFVSLAIVAF
jgi:hypothetical protein